MAEPSSNNSSGQRTSPSPSTPGASGQRTSPSPSTPGASGQRVSPSTPGASGQRASLSTPGASGQRASPSTPGGSGRGMLMKGRRLPADLSPGRLPTMLSRDLTLGGVKKATFTPNIIARRTKGEAKAEGGGEPRRERRNIGRGRGRGRPELIQSHSIFEERPAEAAVKRRGPAYESAGPSPVVKIKREAEEEEDTKEIIRDLERVNILDDPSLRSEERNCPVQLPLAVSGWGFREEYANAALLKVEKVEEDEGEPTGRPVIRVKQEPPEDGALPIIKKEPADNRSRAPAPPEPDVLADLLHRWSLGAGEELLFMQLPDSLPGPPRAKESRPVEGPEARTAHGGGQSLLVKTQTQPKRAKEEENDCTLRDLREGLVGKMVVRRSGRVQLILGDVTLDVALGAPCAFLQDLVSIGTDGGTGDMAVLGHVKQKLVCSPDFEALLENRT